VTTSFDQGWNQALEAAADWHNDRAEHLLDVYGDGIDSIGTAAVETHCYSAHLIRAMKRPQPANVRAADGDLDLSRYRTAVDLQRAREAAQAPSWARADSGVE
jgi:hypothetical protein